MSRPTPAPLTPQPEAPDFGILLVLALRVYLDELHAELAARGFPDMRPSFGVVFRALDERSLTLTALAAQLNLTKQGAAKVVHDLVARGFVAQHVAEEDRRAKTLALTARGRAIVRAAKEIGTRVEARLVAEVGAKAAAGMRVALEHLVISGGGATEMRAKRSRPVW